MGPEGGSTALQDSPQKPEVRDHPPQLQERKLLQSQGSNTFSDFEDMSNPASPAGRAGRFSDFEDMSNPASPVGKVGITLAAAAAAPLPDSPTSPQSRGEY